LTVLLDTHIWIWWVSKQAELSDKERAALDAAAQAGEVALSAISLWEVQVLFAKRRLEVDMPFEAWLLQAAAPSAVKLIPLDIGVIFALNRLPESFHGDPADRIIVATARAFDLPLATRDGAIRRSDAARLWTA
jgi:PIN domain nuclease of toxin-antitoxin system